MHNSFRSILQNLRRPYKIGLIHKLLGVVSVGRLCGCAVRRLLLFLSFFAETISNAI